MRSRATLAGAVAEAVQIEVAADLAVQARQQVEGECSSDALHIVVGGFDQCRVLVQIDADQSQAIAAHGLAHRAQQCDGILFDEIAQRGARKNNRRRAGSRSGAGTATARVKSAQTGSISTSGSAGARWSMLDSSAAREISMGV